MDNQYRFLLEHPLTKMNMVGLLTAKTGFIRSLLAKIYIASYAFMFTLAFMQFFYMDWTILSFVDQSESLCSISQVFNSLIARKIYLLTNLNYRMIFQTFSKLTICFWQKRKFLNLFRYSAKFWNTDNCTEETKKRISNLSNNILLLQKAFFYACLVCIAAVLLSVFGGRKLPIGTWNMTEYNTLYKIDLTVTNIAFLLNCLFISSYDCLFVGFCGEVGIQFQILYDHLENITINKENCNQDIMQLNKKLNACIRQHSFLIR